VLGRRGTLWWVIALVLGVGGGVLLGVGLGSQQHAPQPTAAQANPAMVTVSVSATVSVPSISGSASSGAGSSSTTPRAFLTSARAGAPTLPTRSTRPAQPEPPGSATPPRSTSARPLALAASVPLSVRIPSIGVDSSLLQLGLNPDQSIQVPPLLEKNSHAGWYKYSSTPGELGPSVILGHVDSAEYGPAVFFQLGALQPGARVEVTLTDGTVAVFTVDRVVSYPKANFPTEAVYGSTSTPYAGLRLITCGGTFDPAAKSYENNIVAYARLAASHPASR